MWPHAATKSELRADAAPFTPSHADVPTPKRPPGDPNDPPRKPPGLDKVPIKSEPQSSSKRTADNAVKRTAVDPKAPAKPSADSVPVKEEASVADRVKREGQAAQQSTARAASKRPREDPAAETSRAGSKVPKQAAAEESKAAADPDLQNEPKRRKVRA